MQFTRRTALGSGLAGFMLMGTTTAPAGDPVVETTLGRVRGQGRNGSLAFLGIRYAEAERFRAPRKPKPHAGVTDALGFGASAPQTNPAPPAGPPQVILAQLPRPAGAPPPPRLPESEDCLFLNIWTAATGHGAKRPVMVWLHGGFFSSSSGSTVDGSAVASRGDVVVVSLNHRLNLFGFTALEGEDFRHSGNLGMLDIMAALEWVRDNIAAFGGDPACVTVMGTSGGGMKTAFLAASPRSRGLLHRAAIHSGPVLRFMEREEASRAADLLFRELGAKPGEVDRLLKASTAELLGAYHRVAAQLPARSFTHLPCFAPVRDGDVLPENPFSPHALRQLEGLPLFIGSNHDEMSFFMGNDPAGFTLDEAGLTARVQDRAGGKAGTVLALYARLHPAMTPSQRWIRFFSDLSITVPTMLIARRKAALDGKVWRYRFDYPSPALEGKLGATHTLEGSLIFNTPGAGAALLGTGEVPGRLGREMSATWGAFARDGRVSPQPLPAYTPANGATLVFGAAPTHVEADADRDVFDLLAPLVEG